MSAPIMVDGELVEVISEGHIRVASISQAGVWHEVTYSGCDCKGYEIRKRCRHSALLTKYDLHWPDVYEQPSLFGETDPPPQGLFTSRYTSTLVNDRQYAPIGITVGRPKFPLRYMIAAYIDALAPFGILNIEDPSLFAELYRKRLDLLGVDRIRTLIARAARGKAAVLLCYENVLKNEDCHRRDFAEWWKDRTGEEVKELGS